MGSEVSLQLELGVARALRGLAGETRESRALRRRLEELGVRLRPLHPGSREDALVPHFVAALPEGRDPRQILGALRSLAGVEAAYVKPPDEPP